MYISQCPSADLRHQLAGALPHGRGVGLRRHAAGGPWRSAAHHGRYVSEPAERGGLPKSQLAGDEAPEPLRHAQRSRGAPRDGLKRVGHRGNVRKYGEICKDNR